MNTVFCKNRCGIEQARAKSTFLNICLEALRPYLMGDGDDVIILEAERLVSRDPG